MKWLKPVHVDGALYASIAFWGAVESVFSTDDAYKYVSPYAIFWIKAVSDIALAVAGALKMFRSTTYSDHLKNDPPRGGATIENKETTTK